MLSVKRIICWIVLQACFVAVFAADRDMMVVKRNICESYLRLLNVNSELQQRIAEIGRNSENPDIMIRELKEGVSPAIVDHYLATLGTDGAWADLNYKDVSRSGWQPSFHAERLAVMAKAYRDASGGYFENAELGKAIHRGMAYWFAGDFRCRNWWYNQIGVPKMLGTVFLLMEPEMNGTEKAAAIKYMENARLGMTGQNSVWLAENVLIRSLLQDDEALFAEARNAILKELKVNETGEGIRPDWSFHQHGAQLQFGNYGLAFANTMSYWARMFQDTRFALTNEQLETLRNYLLEGMQWIVWKRNMDISSCGRQLFVHGQEGKALSYGKAVQNMLVADAKHAKEYSRLYAAHVLDNGTPNVVVGNRYYPFSDFGVHRAKDWYATLKMSSSRVIGSEIVNSENLSGYYMGDGALYVYRRGDEFRDIFPVWDWTKIPGVTSCDDQQVFGKAKAYTQNPSDFVGGVSDGKTGIAAMILNKNGLTGRKSYFFTGKAVVCVGSGIRTTQPDPVTTTVAQCLKNGKVYSMPGGEESPAFYHDGIAYIFREGAQVKMTEGMQAGNWRKVASFYDTVKVEKEVFCLGIEHGISPQDGAYCYGVIPGVTEKNWRKEAARFPVEVLEQSENVHAVGDGQRWQMVFFAPGTARLSAHLNVSADQGCIVMMKPEKKACRIWVGEPTWKQKNITLRLSGEWKGKECRYDAGRGKTTVTIPAEGLRGKTVQLLITAV